MTILGGGQIGSVIEGMALGMGDVMVVDLKGVRINGENTGVVAAEDMKVNPLISEVLHVCIPWGDGFIGSVLGLVGEKTELVIIHSTVPVGTTERVNEAIGREVAVHSPVRGIHPDLEEGIRKFVKYVGTDNELLQIRAAKHLSDMGCENVVMGPSSRDTELAKILSTTYYGWNIIFEKEVNRICKAMGCDFDTVYTSWNRSYNEGYEELGKGVGDEVCVVRPVLKQMDGPIDRPYEGKGGHCITSNVDFIDTFLTRVIKERNETYY
jgi:hypothetical protein